MTHKRFEFRVHGPVSEDARYASFSVVDAPLETIIFWRCGGRIHLCGVLALVRSLDLHLISMHELRDCGVAAATRRTPGNRLLMWHRVVRSGDRLARHLLGVGRDYILQNATTFGTQECGPDWACARAGRRTVIPVS